MKRYLRFIICLCFTNIKFIIIKLFHNKFKYNMYSVCSPFSEIEIRNGKLYIDKGLKMRSNSHIRVRSNAIIKIGKNFSMNYGCMLVSHKKIEIGNNVILAPNVMIYDHDHDYKKSLIDNKYNSKPIIIGSNVWIGANSVILKGSYIGDNVVIGAGTIVCGKIPNNTVVYRNNTLTVKKYR